MCPRSDTNTTHMPKCPVCRIHTARYAVPGPARALCAAIWPLTAARNLDPSIASLLFAVSSFQRNHADESGDGISPLNSISGADTWRPPKARADSHVRPLRRTAVGARAQVIERANPGGPRCRARVRGHPRQSGRARVQLLHLFRGCSHRRRRRSCQARWPGMRRRADVACLRCEHIEESGCGIQRRFEHDVCELLGHR